jgi:hypothetical protein
MEKPPINHAGRIVGASWLPPVLKVISHRPSVT